jgi:hypothetical protein
VLKLGGGDHRKFDRVGYMIGLVAGYVTCLKFLAVIHVENGLAITTSQSPAIP